MAGVARGAHVLARDARPTARQELFARGLIWLHVVGILASLVLWVMFHRGPVRMTWFELFFTFLNVPVSGSPVSIVLLTLMARLLVGRKRAGLVVVAIFQVLALLAAVAAVTAIAVFPEDVPEALDVWSWHFISGLGLDILASIPGVLLLAGCWWARPSFPGRLRRGSWVALVGSIAAGALLAALVAWISLRLAMPQQPTLLFVRAVFARVLGFGGPPQTHGVHIEAWILQVPSALLALGLILGAFLFTRSAENPTRWTADRELAVRRLLAQHGDLDSLGYFSTRRDKASVFSDDGRAAVCYDVVAGVSLASGNPVGAPDAWGQAIAAWKAEARHYGWIPAVLGAGEDAARAYAALDFDVLALGDEAILEPDRYRINNVSMTDVRRACERARHARWRCACAARTRCRVRSWPRSCAPPSNGASATPSAASRWRSTATATPPTGRRCWSPRTSPTGSWSGCSASCRGARAGCRWISCGARRRLRTAPTSCWSPNS